MALKRDIDLLSYSDTEDVPAPETKKRQKTQQSGKSKRQPNVDPTYGQKWAFSVMEAAPSDDELEFEDQSEALEYLRAVQQETSKIPHVVVAPKAGPQLPPGYTLPPSDNPSVDRAIYTNGVGDSRGYYHDGAYTAAPDYRSDEDGGDGEEQASGDPTATHRAALEAAYFSSLTSRFLALRRRLHTPPLQSALDALPAEHETQVPSFGPNRKHNNSFSAWTHRLRYTDPLPAQVAAMDKVSVLRLLRVLLNDKFFRRGCVLTERTSRWVWALLARLPDRGEMDSDEVGAVRDLGKRAVLVSIEREHVEGLCEVLGREQVVALGLAGVLREIEGKAEERRVVVGDGEGDGGYTNEDEIRLSPEADEQDGAEDVPDGQGPVATAVVKDGIDLEDGELPDEVQPSPPLQPAVTHIDDADDGDVPMDIEEEEGEVSKKPSSAEDTLAALKKRLLSDLDKTETWAEERPPSPAQTAKKSFEDDSVTDLVNMRATVNMILTVAGEFYGQRDLLAFRDPFGGVPFETDGDAE